MPYSKLSREQLDFLIANAYNAAINAGVKIMEIYRGEGDFQVRLKADNTPLTLADSEAHRVIHEQLKYCRLPILSEEGRDMLYEERAGWDLFWMVDPLDGTEEFIRQTDEFTVNIALIASGKPIFGVIYIPSQSRVYFSDPDRGAFLVEDMPPSETVNFSISEIFETAIRLKARATEGSVVRVATSKLHESRSVEWFYNRLSEQYDHIEEVPLGSSAKFCMLASGEVDFYLRTTESMEWDTAAGVAIARSAGFQVRGLDNEDITYNKEALENIPFVCGVDLAAVSF